MILRFGAFVIRLIALGFVWLYWILMIPTGVVLTFTSKDEFDYWRWLKTGQSNG